MQYLMYQGEGTEAESMVHENCDPLRMAESRLQWLGLEYHTCLMVMNASGCDDLEAWRSMKNMRCTLAASQTLCASITCQVARP